MKALTAANELAALQQEQLMQIRALLVQEQQALWPETRRWPTKRRCARQQRSKFFNVPHDNN